MVDDKERFIRVLGNYTGRHTEQGHVVRVGEELVLRADGKDDVPLRDLEAAQLRSLLSEMGHSGFYP